VTICTPIVVPALRTGENPAYPLSSIFEGSDVWDGLTGGESSAAGVRVNPRRALGYSALWRGVNLIAGAVGRLPMSVYKRVGKGKAIDTAHPAHRLLRRKPNPYMTAYTFRQTLQAHALLRGNGYASIRREGGRPVELLPLDPDKVTPVRANGELWYVVRGTAPGKRRQRAADWSNAVRLPSTDVLHIRGLGFDGLCGYDVVRILRDTIGGALAARDYGSRYFANDGRPGLVLEVPAGMKPEAVANLRASWDRMHSGVANAHKLGILRDGVKLVQIAKNARDAQLIENREFDAREIANVLGVPPHKVGDPSRTAYNSLESENQSLYDDTLDGWFVSWEEECEDKLLAEDEKADESYQVEFNRRMLLRANLAARGAYYVQAVTHGWMSADEVRAEEGSNPTPNGEGATFWRPANLLPAADLTRTAGGGDPAADPEPEPEPEPEVSGEGAD
jgi:HK97 family phage portal protein